MKKKTKFYVFGNESRQRLLIFLMLAISFILLLGMFHFTAGSAAEYVSGLILSGTKNFLPISSATVTRTALRFSLPALTYSVHEDAVLPDPTEPAETESVPPLPVPQDNSQSVTYRTAEENGYVSSNGIYINNQTDASIDLDALLNAPLPFSISPEPSVLIVHTHTSESYTPSEKYNYTPGETDRTQDLQYNMAAVGDAVYRKLVSAGINVIHDKTINDYPSYSGSYSKALKLIESYTEKYPSIKVVLDIHRDAIIKSDGTKIKTVTTINGESAAQVMLVAGTDKSGLNHPDWKTNLSFALKLQYEMNKLYPSLARPINLRKQRFNQHTAPGALIVEVGTNGNTLDEALKGASLFADALISVLSE